MNLLLSWLVEAGKSGARKQPSLQRLTSAHLEKYGHAGQNTPILQLFLSNPLVNRRDCDFPEFRLQCATRSGRVRVRKVITHTPLFFGNSFFSFSPAYASAVSKPAHIPFISAVARGDLVPRFYPAWVGAAAAAVGWFGLITVV
jgi:hypothetical protein